MNEGSSTDEDVARRVFEFADGKGPVVVALDSMHTHEHVMRELELYSPLVGAGSYIVVFLQSHFHRFEVVKGHEQRR